MLWGCHASPGTGNLQCVGGKMDLLKYQEILGENVMLSGRKLKLWCHWTFQQDNEAYLKFHLGLVAEEVLEDSTVAITHLTQTILSLQKSIMK